MPGTWESGCPAYPLSARRHSPSELARTRTRRFGATSPPLPSYDMDLMSGHATACAGRATSLKGLGPSHDRMHLLVALRPRAAAGSSGASQADITRLTEELLEAEGRLAALFEPGKPMPRVGAPVNHLPAHSPP